MSSPHDDGPDAATWASPGGAGPGAHPSDGTPPPPPPAPPAAGWGAPPAPPSAGWGAPPAPPSAGFGTPPAPPTGWAPAPGAAGPATPGGPPPVRDQQPQGWGQPTALPPAWGAPAGPVPGWQPALQPGIIPLRPLGLGEILDGAVRAVRANPSVMFGLSAVVVTVAVALQTLVQLYLSRVATGWLSVLALDESVSASDASMMSGQLAMGAGQVLTAPVLGFVTSVLTGLLIVSVSRSVLGERVALRDVWRTRRVWLLVGFAVLQVLVLLLAVGVLTGAVVALAAAGADGAGIAVLLLGGLGVLVLWLWITTRTLLVPPALMLEGAAFWRTVARAWRLTRGSFWRLLGIYLLSSLLVSVLMYLVLVPVGVVAGIATVATASLEVTLLVSAVGQVVSLTLSTTFLSAVVALLYVDVRIRREGLDLELARAAGAPGAR